MVDPAGVTAFVQGDRSQSTLVGVHHGLRPGAPPHPPCRYVFPRAIPGGPHEANIHASAVAGPAQADVASACAA